MESVRYASPTNSRLAITPFGLVRAHEHHVERLAGLALVEDRHHLIGDLALHVRLDVADVGERRTRAP